MMEEAQEAALAWDNLIEAMEEWVKLMKKETETTCGLTREDHDVAYCVRCEGGFCLKCGRADKWFLTCIHRPAWRNDY